MKRVCSLSLLIFALCFLQGKVGETFQGLNTIPNFDVSQNYSGVYFTQGSVLQDTDWNPGGIMMGGFMNFDLGFHNSFWGGQIYNPVFTSPGFSLENQFLNYTPDRTGNFSTPSNFSFNSFNPVNFFPTFSQFDPYSNMGNFNYSSIDSKPYFPSIPYTHWSKNPADIVEGVPYRHAH